MKYIYKVLLILIFLSINRYLFSYTENNIILLTSDKGLQISENSGNTWKKFNHGLPDEFVPVKIYPDNSGKLFLLTKESGIFEFDSGISKWKDISSTDLFEPGTTRYRQFSAFAVSGTDPQDCFLSTKHEIFIKTRDNKWERVNGFPDTNYYTSLTTNSKHEIFAGTSCNGIFRLTGNKAVNISSNLPVETFSKSRYFYEEIAGIVCDGKARIYAAMNFSGDVYVSENNGQSWSSLKFPVKTDAVNEIYDMKLYKNILYLSSDAGIFKLGQNNKWQELFYDILNILKKNKNNLSLLIKDKSGNIPPLFFKLNNFNFRKVNQLTNNASAKKAIYANSYSLNKKLSYYTDIIKKCGFNAIVIDMKDDWGDLCYSSVNKTALEIKAVKKYMDADKIIKHYKNEKIYTIARIVVFKDKRLYESFNNKYAIWNKKTNKAWKGNAKEYWVDPNSEFVIDYNLEIARELEKIGFDEIQLDYIRFPSDGPIWECEFRYKKQNNTYKSEILAEFLREAKNSLKIPVSADIYGFNAWFRFGNVIGQDAEKFSEIIDVLCPMIYPSHYGRSFFSRYNENEKPYQIIYHNMKRAGFITSGNALIRPYIQAFNLLSPTWGTDYIRKQVKAVEDAGFDSYIFWNAGGDYDMVKRAFSE